MTTFLQDIRHTFRLLAGHPGFAAAALLTIALGVGGTAAVFSVVYGVLLRPLPYPEPERLVRMWEVHPGAVSPLGDKHLSRPVYRAWAQPQSPSQFPSQSPSPSPSRSFEAIGAFSGSDFRIGVNTAGAGVVQRVRGTAVTPSVFRLLRVSPAAGRFFTDADADEGAPPVVVLSHAFWRDRFGTADRVADRMADRAAADAAIGRTLIVNGVAHRIIGVTPPGFAFPQRAVGLRDDRRDVVLYKPYAVRQRTPMTVVEFTEAIARLAPGVTAAQVEAEGTALARRVDRPRADFFLGKGGPVEMRVRSLVDQMTMKVRPALMVLAAGVTLVLLIACANLANLFLSRGSARSRELAVRAALGAGRGRLMRQLFTESLVIALLGGALGIAIGAALTAAMPAFAPADFPRLDEIRVDARFLAVAVLAAVFAGVVSGAVPALRGSRFDLAAAMQSGGARSGGASGAGMRRMLLAVEAALAVVLLIGAALLARSFTELVSVDAGYDADRVLTADVRLPGDPGDKNNARTSQRAVALVERLRAIPGVRAAGVGDMAPFGSMLSLFGFALPGVTGTGADGKPAMATGLRAIITPGYAEALGMRLKEGRWFRAEDVSSAVRPILVNEAFVKAYLTDGRPVTGRTYPGMFERWLGKHTSVTIVGVVDDVLPADLNERPQPQIFVAEGGGANIGHVTLVLRTDAAGDPAALMPLVKALVQQMEPAATIERMSPLATKVSASVDEPRFATLVLAAFASLALALAATGLYGVLSFNIAQRRRELAVRAALGATRGDLVMMVMREGLTMTLFGLAAGMALAAAVTRTMASTLFGITPLDPAAFSIAPILLVAVACIACLIPARRALSIDPGEALKAE
jgi:putative ABC transport system permease protein